MASNHHRGKRYEIGAARVRAMAYRDPGAVCWRCGGTLNEHTRARGKPDRWQAGHTIDGSTTWAVWPDVRTVPPPGDWLAPEARSCNAGAAAERTNGLRYSGYPSPGQAALRLDADH